VIGEASKKRLEQRFYPALQRTVFAPIAEALSRPELDGATVIDAGCGKGSWILEAQRAHFRFLVGVDIYVPPCPWDAFTLGSLDYLPFRDASFDLVVCYLVLEHVADPQQVIGEFARVLRPDGMLIFKTPVAYAPTTLLARALPFAAHYVLKAFVGTEKDDVFPTYYRCNTVSALRHLLGQAGFAETQLIQVDQTYAYASFSRVTYALGLLYSRMTAQPWLAWLRNGIIGICRKGGR
jgi:ubiquinone/menaquinone biosynthesis C-methylase UbiE